MAPQALETWDTLTVTKGDVQLHLTSMPGLHGPGLLQALLPPVMGTMLEWHTSTQTPRFRLYISGDTLMHERLGEIPQRYPHIDLALLHLGGTRVLGVSLTMDAAQGVQALHLIRPRAAIPIHYNDYTVFKSPLEAFMQAAREARLETVLHYLSHGETYTFDVPAC